MRYLVDANVLSEPTKPFPHPRAIEWPRKNERDILIAATALVHDLTVATRNRRDFESAGVESIDPFTA